MTGEQCVHVWTMCTDGLTEPGMAAWHTLLDAAEQARAARFVFSRHRVTYVAAHALVRLALSTLCDGVPSAAWRFVAGVHGKPVAWQGDQPVALSFNLSHADGIVGLAALEGHGHALGFDLEALDRRVTLDVADHYFRPEEVAWLASLPQDRRAAGFLRLWTLKEAFIKATGDGLARDLASFWFALAPPRIHFTDQLTERPEHWSFEQRIIDRRFVAAVGLRRPPDRPVRTQWIAVDSLDRFPATR